MCVYVLHPGAGTGTARCIRCANKGVGGFVVGLVDLVKDRKSTYLVELDLNRHLVRNSRAVFCGGVFYSFSRRRQARGRGYM